MVNGWMKKVLRKAHDFQLTNLYMVQKHFYEWIVDVKHIFYAVYLLNEHHVSDNISND